MSASPYAICEQCDAVYRRNPLPPGARACCIRCGQSLYANRPLNVDALLALALSSLIVFAIAQICPIAEFQLGGETSQTTLWGAVLAAFGEGVGPVGMLAAINVFFAPLLLIALSIYVLLPLRMDIALPGFVTAMHALRALRRWSMVEVFMLGVLVAVVKLAGTATVIPGVGIGAFAVLTVLLALVGSFDLHEVWDRYEAGNGDRELDT